MDDPVMGSDGATYERAAIEDWLKVRNTSPLTIQRMTKETLVTNVVLQKWIEYWKKKHSNSNDKSDVLQEDFKSNGMTHEELHVALLHQKVISYGGHMSKDELRLNYPKISETQINQIIASLPHEEDPVERREDDESSSGESSSDDPEAVKPSGYLENMYAAVAGVQRFFGFRSGRRLAALEQMVSPCWEISIWCLNLLVDLIILGLLACCFIALKRRYHDPPKNQNMILPRYRDELLC